MIIVHVIADLSTGGAEMMLKRLVDAHRETPEFEHHIISLHGLARIGPELQAKGIRVEALGMRGPLDMPKVVAQLARRIRLLRPDILHAWMYHANLLGGLAARIGGRSKVIWGIRATSFDASMGVSRLTTWLRRVSGLASRWLPDVIVYVAHAAREGHEKIGYFQDKGMVIPNGYPRTAVVSRGEARERLGLPANGVVIGSLGRYNAAKDPRTFIEAASLIAKRHADARFVMVGRGISPGNRELMAWIADHGLEDRFLLLEERKDVDECLAAMDVFCLHSVTEAFPNVVAEAMSVGVACVVTDVGDAALLLGDAGVVVPVRNPIAMAEAISTMIEAGPDVRAAYGRRGRERIATCFSIGAVVRRYEALYRDLVANARYFPPKARGVQS
jgi:glycosyltransferase involved in cell wall biosynthesis